MSANDDVGRSREERLNDLMASYVQAVEEGKAPHTEEWIALHPDLVEEFKSFLADYECVNKLAGPLRDAARAAHHEAFQTEGFRAPILGAGTELTDPASTPHGGENQSFSTDPRIRYFGDYMLTGEIARGGMGVVYRARQISLNRQVAIKMILSGTLASEADVLRFRNEAEAVANLDHPGIVPIYEVGTHDGDSYFSMKLIEGPSLGARLDKYTADPRAAARLLAAVARAVHHAHQRGVLHRDLKPSNILLDAQGEPHVSDFGLAKRVEGDSDLTQSGAILGSPPYMAPEQTTGRRGAVTTATDVYGLGAIFYATLTGRAPFRADSILETLEHVRQRDPDPPSGINHCIDRDLQTICLKCLAKEPSQRYATALELAEDLERWRAGKPIAARPVGRLERSWRWCRRNPLVAGLTGVVATLMIAGIVGLSVSNRMISKRSAEVVQQRDLARTERDAANAARGAEVQARKQAEGAETTARAALSQARVQRRRAETSLVAALDAVHRRIMTVGDPDQASRQALSERQEHAAEDAIWFYRNLLSRGVTDPTSGLEQGDVYLYLASVYRLKRDPDASLETLGKAIEAYRSQVESEPSDWDGWANLGQGYNILGQTLWDFKRAGEAVGAFKEASEAYHEAVRLGADVPRALNYLAWFLCLCPDQKYRDSTKALVLSGHAVQLAPKAGNVWNTLGIARYRNGDWDGAVTALKKSMELNDGGDGVDWFFVSMALSRKGDPTSASEWLHRASEWADRSDPFAGEIRRIRAEAIEAIGKGKKETIPINR